MVTGKTFSDKESTGTASTPKLNGVVVRAELMCVKCGKRWETDIQPYERLSDIRCGLCGLTGFVINTGQGF